MVIAASTAFAALFSFFAPERPWIEAVSESFVPYGAAPLAVGYASARSRPAVAALIGAVASVSMVTAFYLVRPLLVDSGILTSDLLFWSAIGAASGASIALIGGQLLTRISASFSRWTVGTGLAVVLVQLVYVLLVGWGRLDVTTRSGLVTVGYSTSDIAISILVTSVFSGGLVLSVVWLGARSGQPAGPAH